MSPSQNPIPNLPTIITHQKIVFLGKVTAFTPNKSDMRNVLSESLQYLILIYLRYPHHFYLIQVNLLHRAIHISIRKLPEVGSHLYVIYPIVCNVGTRARTSSH